MIMINTYRRNGSKKGFTLIEILVVIGIIAVLAAVVLVAVNPSRQFKLARDSQRVSNITAILNAVGQDIAEHRGLFYCGTTTQAIPSTSTPMTNNSSINPRFDIVNCIVPNYISSLPFDPSKSGAGYIEGGAYDTGYSIAQDANGRITISAIGEITNPISVTR
jgi:prepilin-type N-terminal cleavage/methylation domain-containing protein